MRRFLILLLAGLLCFGLCGCSLWMNGSYVSVEPHPEQDVRMVFDELQASSYLQMRDALVALVEDGLQDGIIYLYDLNDKVVDSYMEAAIRYVSSSDPIGAYAVDEITYEIGRNAGKAAIAVDISYTHNRAELLRIKYADDMEEATEAIGAVLEQSGTSVVIKIDQYEPVDFAELVQSYADTNPHMVMESPQVMAAVYPDSGETRVVELTFTYQTDHDSLLLMQELVRPVFIAAELYVQGDSSAYDKYAQLYAFLMERYDYEIETSVTPTYALLQQGIGDCKAFACVYAEMCEQAGLNCQVAYGVRNGEPWYWNVISQDNIYYHIDLLRSNQSGGFRLYREYEMPDYTWDRASFQAD